MKFGNFRLARKLSIGFGAVLALVAASSTFVYSKVEKVVEIERVNSVSSDAIDDLDRARGDIEAVRANMRKFVLTGKDLDKTKTLANIAEHGHRHRQFRPDRPPGRGRRRGHEDLAR